MEQKKAIRIGKFNIVDIIAVILILAVVIYGASRLLNREEVSSATIPITYVVMVENVAPELYENSQAHLPAQLMAKSGLLDGHIESVEKAPYLVAGPDGQWLEDPNHINLYFTCTANVPQESFLTTKIGEQEVRIGKTDYIMKSEYVEFQRTTIVDVQWGE